jgi:hypothetical protein
MAVGILMERYSIGPRQASAFLVRNSQTRNIKVRVLARQVVDGTFQSTLDEDSASSGMAIATAGVPPAHLRPLTGATAFPIARGDSGRLT